MSDIFLLNPKNDINDNVEGGFIPMACVCDGYSGEHTFITKQWGDIKKGFSHFQNGDIGIAKISPCFENRKSVIFSDLPNNIGSGTTELVVLRGILVNSAFYLLLIKSDWYISEGTKYFKGVVGQQRVHKDIFTTLQVPMPPLREQQKIVDSVKNWFSVIDEIENGVTELETVIKQAKSKILDLAISGKLVPQYLEDEPAIELLKRINPAFQPCDNSHYENLPQGWVKAGFKDIYQTISSRDYQIQQRDIINEGLYPVVSQSSNYIEGYYNNKEMLLDVTAPVLIFGDHTRVVKYIDFPFVIGADGVKVIKPLVNDKFAYYLLLYTSQHIENKGYSRHFQLIAKANYCIPPLREQTHIVKTIETLFETINTITAEL